MMKTGSALCVLLGIARLACAADICPNFSGQYLIQGEDGQVQITIAQTGCEQIRIDRTSNYLGKITTEQHTLKIDGKFQEDTPWLGSSVRNQTSVKFTSASLEIVVRPASATGASDFSSKFLYVLRSNGDLDIREFDPKSDAYVPAVMAVRRQ